MPDKGLFRSIEEYYATLFHDIAHSTGHPSRLGRQHFSEPIVSRDLYSKEELVAEMANCFLCGESGIRTPTVIENQAAYRSSWIGVLRASPRLLIAAAADADAAEFIDRHGPAVRRFDAKLTSPPPCMVLHKSSQLPSNRSGLRGLESLSVS